MGRFLKSYKRLRQVYSLMVQNPNAPYLDIYLMQNKYGIDKGSYAVSQTGIY